MKSACAEKRRGGRGPAAARLFARLLLAALLLPVLAAPGAAGKIYPSAGTTSAAFLKLGVGARAAAMGGAFTAVPGDPYAIYWNPAGLAGLDGGVNAGFFHNDYFQDLGQEFLFYTAPAGGFRLPLAGPQRRGAVGLGLDYFYTPGKLERRSGLNESDPLNPVSPVEGRFGAYDLAASAAYGWEAGRGLAFGAALKVIRQSVDNRSGASAALDLGALRSFDWRGDAYTAGFSVQNVGPGIKFTDRRYALPLVFKTGLSRRLPGRGGLVSLEADKPVDNYPSFALGVEYPLTGRLSLRSGYRYRLHGNELGPWSGFSAGAGVAFDRVSFDYAFSPFGALGDSHRFSLNFRFGGEARRAKRAEQGALSMPGARVFVFSSAPRAVSMSPRGIKYELKASAPGCGLYGISFKTLARGEVPAEFRAGEAEPPAYSPAGLPAGYRALKVWQLPSLPGQVQGDLKLDFRLPRRAGAAGGTALLYLENGSWKDASAAPAGTEGEFDLFTAVAPQAEYFAAVVKD